MSIIQVTGLPRSGTAWVSTLLNLNPECIAFHELIASHSPETMNPFRDGHLMRYKFVADCGTYQYLPRVNPETGPKVAILRDEDESRIESERVFEVWLDADEFSETVAKLRCWIEEKKPLLILFENLFTVKSAESIWHHVFGDEAYPFPVDKVQLLVAMQVQRWSPSTVFAPDGPCARVKDLT